MAGPIRNSRVAAGSVPGGIQTNVYTVPLMNVLLLKNIILFSSAPATTDTYIVFVSGSVGIYVELVSGAWGDQRTITWNGWTAMNQTDFIAIASTVGLNYWISGATLPFNPNL